MGDTQMEEITDYNEMQAGDIIKRIGTLVNLSVSSSYPDELAVIPNEESIIIVTDTKPVKYKVIKVTDPTIPTRYESYITKRPFNESRDLGAKYYKMSDKEAVIEMI